ncbi:hypothetical protein ACTFIZ_000713 [Dictyostelium cf. discoideum]
MVELYDTFGIKIYVDHNKTTIKGIDLQKKLAKFFLKKNIPHSLISIFDIANNFEIQRRIKEHSKKIPRYPYIEINGQLWGEGIEVEESEEMDEILKDLINYKIQATEEQENNSIVDAFIAGNTMVAVQPETLSIGYLDSGLNLIEWLSLGIVSNIWNPWAIPTQPLDKESDFEFDVIRTNWYGRHQFRKYRFTPSEIVRINSQSVKATLYYKDIQQLDQTNKKNIIIKILNGEDQYIEALEDDINKMIEIITSRAYLVPNGENQWVSKITI